MKTVALLTAVLVSVPALADDKPISLKAMGSFYVGGVAAGNPRLKLTVDYLPESGIRGNSHMMMLDRNNKQIADRIVSWIFKGGSR